MIISQREARRLRKRVDELEKVLEDMRNRWCRGYPGGVHIGWLSRNQDWLTGRIDAAHMLKHAVVIRQDDSGTINFYALPIAKEPS